MLKELNYIRVDNLKELEPRFSSQQSFYGKALVKYGDNLKVLYSYLTPVAYVENGKQVITNDDNLLSKTTMKHIHEFLNQYGFEDLPKQELIKKYGGNI